MKLKHNMDTKIYTLYRDRYYRECVWRVRNGRGNVRYAGNYGLSRGNVWHQLIEKYERFLFPLITNRKEQDDGEEDD